ncbi:SepM family pheromone-processing serine protease [Virgibacillus sp. 179-BFC.A HS]|uniref:endopeptidase La n=1 Tax=Tigheibacillus jepli TaxID=3035914 RepID=A0ABU5CI23_9BACI|nr:SepM family pheromone-processing serine protease [Virgibacillus sp. 179-BFC.A HS]MDY0405978.1 SepM family pheromone-processing serine protease [Virgibacillus sp. 179-BFC.A HS]
MRIRTKHIVTFLVVMVIAVFLATYQLPYYIQKPGSADALDPIVSVDNGYKSKGDMHLVTVRGGQATPIQYAMAKVLPHEEIIPIDKVMPKGISKDDYFHAQLQMMESSQEAATVVAYKAANKDIKIRYDGVYVVSTVKGMPADGKLKSGDRITGVDGRDIKEANDLINYVQTKKPGNTLSFAIERDGEKRTEKIGLKEFKDQKGKIGIGIQLVTDRSVSVKPEVHFKSGDIGGPSAGLMFSLKIYDELTKQDLTHGLQICGTGEIDYDGNVMRIGGIDKKVIAADKAGCNIFFAPNERGAKESNYKVAKKAAKEIGTDMKIVPVDTFQDALHYLENMDKGKK